MTLMLPNRVRYRPAWRPATPGVEYDMYDEGTDLIYYKAFNCDNSLPLNNDYNNLLGRDVFFRFKLSADITYTEFFGWNHDTNKHLFGVIRITSNVWHSVRVKYGTTPTSTHSWYYDGSLVYNGTYLTGPYILYNTNAGSRVLYDIGQHGGTLPDGCEWWPKSYLL